MKKWTYLKKHNVVYLKDPRDIIGENGEIIATTKPMQKAIVSSNWEEDGIWLDLVVDGEDHMLKLEYDKEEEDLIVPLDKFRENLQPEAFVSIFDAFQAMMEGWIVEDTDGYWYRKDGDELVEATLDDERIWGRTEEFKYGTINNKEWRLVKKYKKPY